MVSSENNLDPRVVDGFGEEWKRFDQSELTEAEREIVFAQYFSIFPWQVLPANAVGADIGCGTGRWAKTVAERVGLLHVADPSLQALDVAKQNLKNFSNIRYHLSSVENLPFPDRSLDFAYSLGVLHHIPDTKAGLSSLAKKLKPGAPILIYLYYAFDNRPIWYRWLWKLSDLLRRVISSLPFFVRATVSEILAATIYFPLSRMARILEVFHCLPSSWPLSYYRNRSYYMLRTDALDRFGTKLERRFTKKQIEELFKSTGFEKITFSDSAPYWCATAFKRLSSN
ncbi:MAG: 2-polyprenyl-3-methyl-5-hydroxy-6-metoxy, 4-benzoquinol methylase [Bacteriovoracaceae bacterium]|nr:2-polyprenyl-3-methyl-5-hydroxy-6-metoxy, 4-benzoquinol methylase [Bacteriovoracaceae bacterium]